MPRAEHKSRRRLWFSLHSWVGLKLSLLFFFVSLTGTIAVYAYEVDWLLTPALRAEAPEGSQRRPAGILLAAGLAAHPNWTPNFFYANLPSYMAAELIAQDQHGERRRIYINPYTAKVQGTADWFNAHRFLREAHRHLMLPLKWGLTIVSLLSIPLLLSMVSAFPIFKRWWRGFFKVPQRADPPRRWWGNLHRWLGLWSLPFILVIGLTGFWYLIELWGASAPQPNSELRPLPEAGALPKDADTLNQNIQNALSQWPNYQLDRIWFPGDGQPLVLQGQSTALLVRPRANTLVLDPASGEILGRIRGEELSAHQRIGEAADPLHFGTFGGQITRFLWFIWGIMLCLLSASGAWIYALRLSRRTSSRARKADRPPSTVTTSREQDTNKTRVSSWRQVWQGLTLRWVQAALVLICLGLTGVTVWA